MSSRKKVLTESDFNSILRDGLSSYRSYVILRQKNRSPIFLQFKPFAHRINGSVIYIGGKLSAFPDANHEKFSGLSERQQEEALRSAWKTLPADRHHARRVGSNAGIYFAAGVGDAEAAKAAFDKNHLINLILKGIEKALDIEISNEADVKAYLNVAYDERLLHVFGDGGNKIPARMVGKKSGLLVGQSHVSGNGGELNKFGKEAGLLQVA
jgi:hypothetical protein